MPDHTTPTQEALAAIEHHAATRARYEHAQWQRDNALVELRFALGGKRPAGARRIAAAINAEAGAQVISEATVERCLHRAATGAPRPRAGRAITERAERIARRIATEEDAA